MSEERIQRILARAGILSRRQAKELLREGRVTVNGQVAEVGGRADPEKDAIKVDGRRIQPHLGPYRYLLLNKPKGVLTTVSDPEGRTTVMDFVPPAFRKALVPVGRLDYNSEGLILLTDDGELAQHVAHPRYGGVKTYEVKVKGRPDAAQIDRLRAGISIDGRLTAPARIVPLHAGRRTERRRGGGGGKQRATKEGEGASSWWVVELSEGRTRQIREMFFRVGHPVQKLRRVAIGPLRDPGLPVGAVRELTEREVELLRRVTAKPKKPAAARTKPEAHGPSPAGKPPRPRRTVKGT